MGDVLESGPRRPLPPWLGRAALVLLLAGAATAYLVTSGSDPGAAPAGARQPTASSSPTPPIGSTASKPAWPTVAGDCGAQAFRPLMTVPPLEERTGLRVLVGGSGLRLVDVDAGTVTDLPGAEAARGQPVTDLLVAGGRVAALRWRCPPIPESEVPRVLVAPAPAGTGPPGPATATSAPPMWGLLALSGHPWGVVADESPVTDPDTHRNRLQRLDGPGTLTLPAGFGPYDGHGSLLLGTLPPASDAPDALPTVAVLDTRRGDVVATPAQGYPVAIGASSDGGSSIVWSQPCHSGSTCAVTVLTLPGGRERSYSVPAGTTVNGAAQLSPDGRLLAFPLARASADSRYAVGHPGTPYDVAVLDLGSGRLQILGGLELAPKTMVGLAFSADSRWLVLTVSEGSHGHLLVWRPGWPTPRRVGLELAGPLVGAPPVAVVPRARTSAP